MSVVFDNLDLFARGLWGTVSLTLLSFALAFVVGVVVASFRVSPIPPLRWAGTVWVETVRNIPLTAVLFFLLFGLPKIDIKFEPFTTAVIGCGLYTSAFVAETVRSGFNAVGTGQAEAARALGLTFPQTLRTVVIPQALRTVVAPMGSVFIALTKNTSIASTISVVELTRIADDLGNETAQWLPIFIGTAVAYLLLTLPSGQATALLERKVAIRR